MLAGCNSGQPVIIGFDAVVFISSVDTGQGSSVRIKCRALHKIRSMFSHLKFGISSLPKVYLEQGITRVHRQ